MKITKVISIFVIITITYIGTAYLVSQPPATVPYFIRMSAFWINFVIDLPTKLMHMIFSNEFYEKYFPILRFMVPLLWTIAIVPWFGKKSSDLLMARLDEGFLGDRRNTTFMPQGFKQKTLNYFGLFMLTDLEDLLIYRISVLLPVNYRQTLKKQLKKMNRTQRIFGSKEKMLGLTVFESRLMYLFGEKKVYPKFELKPYEMVLATCLVMAENGFISVDLIASQGVFSRLQFQSDIALDSIKGPFLIQDIRIHPKITME